MIKNRESHSSIYIEPYLYVVGGIYSEVNK